VPARLSEGELQVPLKSALLAVFYAGAALWALFFFTPEFANSRWPWELNPFDARIMSAWFAGSSVWAVTMYFMKDWAEVKIGVRALLLFVLGLLGVWMFTSSRYELNHTRIAGRQGVAYFISLVVSAGWLLFAYWKQEQAAGARRARSMSAPDVN
jgi:hypothetical protein